MNLTPPGHEDYGKVSHRVERDRHYYVFWARLVTIYASISILGALVTYISLRTLKPAWVFCSTNLTLIRTFMFVMAQFVGTLTRAGMEGNDNRWDRSNDTDNRWNGLNGKG